MNSQSLRLFTSSSRSRAVGLARGVARFDLRLACLGFALAGLSCDAETHERQGSDAASSESASAAGDAGSGADAPSETDQADDGAAGGGPGSSGQGSDAGTQSGARDDAGSGIVRDAGTDAGLDAAATLDASVGPGRDASVSTQDAGPGSTKGTSCDRRGLLCRRAEPVCPEGQVAAIVDSCFGECVRIDQCVCGEAEACPNPDKYTCHRSAMHCDYYVN